MSKIRSGDVVKLKGGGPEMTVEYVRNGHVTCRWFPTRSGGYGFADWDVESSKATFAAGALDVVRAAEPEDTGAEDGGTVFVNCNAPPYTLLIVGMDLADCAEATIPTDVPSRRETVRATIGEPLTGRPVDRVLYGPRLQALLDQDTDEVQRAHSWHRDVVLTRVKP